MSRIGDLKDAINTLLDTMLYPVDPELTIEQWAGEESVFNEDHAWPGISITYAGTEYGELLEQGGITATYEATPVFHVFVYAITDEVSGGDAQASDILEAVEDALSGQVIANLGQAHIIGQELIHAHMGRFLYRQAYKINLLIAN